MKGKMSAEKEKLVCVGEYNDRISATIVSEMLISNGIDATVVGDVSSYPCFNTIDPVRVLVRESDAESAEKLMQD